MRTEDEGEGGGSEDEYSQLASQHAEELIDGNEEEEEKKDSVVNCEDRKKPCHKAGNDVEEILGALLI